MFSFRILRRMLFHDVEFLGVFAESFLQCLTFGGVSLVALLSLPYGQ